MRGCVDRRIAYDDLSRKGLVVCIHHKVIGSGEKWSVLAGGSPEAQGGAQRCLPALSAVEIPLAEVLAHGIPHRDTYPDGQLTQIEPLEVFQAASYHILQIRCRHIVIVFMASF